MRASPEQQHTLERADAYLAKPEIRALLAKRDSDMRASFDRANRRLAGR